MSLDLPNVEKCVATGYERQKFYTASAKQLDLQDEQFIKVRVILLPLDNSLTYSPIPTPHRKLIFLHLIFR